MVFNYAQIIERLRSVIVEKGLCKIISGVVLLHDNAPHSHVHAAIREGGFIELNDCAYSRDSAPTNSHPLSNLKKFLRLKNFRSDDEAVTTVD